MSCDSLGAGGGGASAWTAHGPIKATEMMIFAHNFILTFLVLNCRPRDSQPSSGATHRSNFAEYKICVLCEICCVIPMAQVPDRRVMHVSKLTDEELAALDNVEIPG